MKEKNYNKQLIYVATQGKDTSLTKSEIEGKKKEIVELRKEIVELQKEVKIGILQLVLKFSSN